MAEIKKDCFAYKDDNGVRSCKALMQLYCAFEDKPCPFYKTKQQREEELRVRR